MKVIYNLKDRKPFIKAMEEITGTKAVYQKTPTYAYKVDYFTITRDGNLEFDDMADSEEIENLLEQLADSGFVAEAKEEVEETEKMPQNEDVGLTVAMPREYFTENTLDNLKNLIASKQTLIRKALGVTELPIEEKDEKVSFPWFKMGQTDNNVAEAYTLFIYALCEMAKKQKRVNAKEKEVENEKYAFRCFLLRLGFIGDESKGARKILLQNFTGSAAFKNGGKNDDVSK